ncbi:GNAT family N-acetyltransferase [Kiloniella laminariae]|uniref:GNAT family N-acetyltransferase n=1 Tax=Kiloniella laminariae TaxID=454162 RepID=UPI00047556EA|nr:GNAT family protein [Kiloniella laminariae]
MRRLRLVNKRVYLRVPQMGDWREWAELRHISREFLTPWEPTWSSDSLDKSSFRDKLRVYWLDWRQGMSYSFYAFSRETDELLGGITIGNVRRGAAHMGTIGYWMGEPYSGKGYMTEILSSALDYAFEELALHRLEAACLEHNEASKTVLRKVGFVEEGRARGYLRINALWQDHITFGLLRNDSRLSAKGWIESKH